MAKKPRRRGRKQFVGPGKGQRTHTVKGTSPKKLARNDRYAANVTAPQPQQEESYSY